MKKVLLGVFLSVVLTSYAQETQNNLKNSLSSQKEDIDFSIKETSIQDTSTQNVPDALNIQDSDKTLSMPHEEENDSAPTLAPEISEKNWKSSVEEDEKDKKNSSAEKIKPNQENIPTNTNDQIRKSTSSEEKSSKQGNSPKETKKKSATLNKKENFLEEKPQKTKKITFIQEEFYNPKKNDISVSKTHSKLFLQIHSNELQKFMEGIVYNTKQQVQTFALEDSYTQITNIDGKIQEYKYAQKSIDRYSTIAPHQKYPLKKISKKQYQIMLKKIPDFFDIKGCKIVIKKELTGSLNQTKEIIINLDTKRELRNSTHFDLFLECPQ